MGKRLITFEITFPRIIHTELNTHRMLSRNTASSRAIPFSKMVKKIFDDPFIPDRFPINGKGMQPQQYYEGGTYEYRIAKRVWLKARDEVVKQANKLVGLDEAYLERGLGDDFVPDVPVYINVHKQIANRLLEPFMWQTAIVTATEWDNFFKLRCDENAQHEIRTIADLMYKAYHYYIETDSNGLESRNYLNPQLLKSGQWHCPLVYPEDSQLVCAYLFNNGIDGDNKGVWRNTYDEICKKISVARCARVSYLTHDGVRSIDKDLELFERLRTSGHWSPFEHVATPYFETGLGMHDADFRPESNDILAGLGVWSRNLPSGNFIGWNQYRKQFGDENCTDFRKEQS
jgi:thymidylate synthase ThyX